MDGGLKEESRMKSVFGESLSDDGEGSCGVGLEGATVFSTRNLEPDDRKLSSADASCGTRER